MWNKFKEGFKESLSHVTLESLGEILILIGVVYILAWIFGEPADNVVGWCALGIAAMRTR